MPYYCTNCKWLDEEVIANKTNWLCKRKCDTGSLLPSLCGNPRRAWRCIDENWYELKQKQEKKMKQITVQQFYEICEASLKHFTECKKPQTEEEVELQTMGNWWYEFKQYMEDDK